MTSEDVLTAMMGAYLHQFMQAPYGSDEEAAYLELAADIGDELDRLNAQKEKGTAMPPFNNDPFAPYSSLSPISNQPKIVKTFKVGDRVKIEGVDETAVIEEINTVMSIKHKVRFDDGDTSVYTADDLSLTRKTPEEAWVDATLKIVDQYGWMDDKPLRRECYIILGGAGIKITEAVKARVRAIMARVEASH